MAEINSNIPNFRCGIEKVNNKPEDMQQNTAGKIMPNETESEKREITDTGVLGRSQVKTQKGDISKSVDEAVRLAETQPAVLSGGETLFNSLYRDYLEMGIEPSDAYMKALFGEQEFLEIAKEP